MTPVIATLHHSPTEDLLGRRTARSGDAPRLLLVKLADLGDAVRAAGGPAKVPALGPPSVNRDFQTRLAWEAEIPMEDVELSQGNALVFKATGRQSGARARRSPGARRLGRVGAWEILGPPGERFAARSSPR